MPGSGRLRRVHLHRQEEIRKRILIQVATLNLGLLMRSRFGSGGPCNLQGLAAAQTTVARHLYSAVSPMIRSFCHPIGRRSLMICHSGRGPAFGERRAQSDRLGMAIVNEIALEDRPCELSDLRIVPSFASSCRDWGGRSGWVSGCGWQVCPVVRGDTEGCSTAITRQEVSLMSAFQAACCLHLLRAEFRPSRHILAR